MTSDTFNFEHLTHLLTQAARMAFQTIKQQYPSESIYAFALYTHGDFSYVTSSASSEEGLTQVAHKYLADSAKQKYNLSEQRSLLRWSPADSPLHEVGSEFFGEVDTVLEEVSVIMEALYDEENDSYDDVETFAQHIEHCFITALQTLDREGVFGTYEQRRNITINFLMGDQSDESRIQYAKQLNPPEVWQRYAEELAERNKLWRA